MAKVREAILLGSEERVRVAARLTDGVRQAASDAESHWESVRRNRALLRDEQPRSNPPWEGASELVVPYVKQAKFALLSHFCPTLLGPDPIFHVDGANPASKRVSTLIERFLQAQLTRQMRFRRSMERLFDAALRDGTAIAHVYWRTTRRMQPGYDVALTPVMDEATGTMLAPAGSIVEVERKVTVYDAPALDLVPVERFGTFPTANADIQESPGVFFRVLVTGEEILQRMACGEFDTEAVERLRAQGVETPEASADSLMRSIGEGTGVTDFRARSFTLTQIYYRYAPNKADGPLPLPPLPILGEGKTSGGDCAPAEDWLFTLHEPSGILLQARPSPWFHRQRPFIALSPYQDIEGFYGDSLAAAGAGHVQLGKTTLLRLAVDAAAIGVSPELLVAASLGKHIGDIKKRRGPGGVIPFPDAFFENPTAKLQPFGNHGYTPTIVLPLLELLDREGQFATGVSDTLKGVPNAGNVSATEAAQLMESAQKLVAFLTERLAEGLSDLGTLIQQLNYQFQGNEGVQRLWQEVNGESGVPLFAAMQGSYTVSASGVRDTNNRAILAKRAMERVQILMNEPMVMSNPERRYALLYDTLQANGTAQPERYLGSVEEWTQGQGGMPLLEQMGARS